jgi:predicted phage terminase large subunit-like protein
MSHDAYFLHTPKGIRAVRKEDCTHFLTVDPAISENESADFMVIQKWGQTEFKDLLLIDVIRGHWGHREQQKEIEDTFNENKEEADFIAVETTAYQHALFTDLLDKGLPCRPFKPHKDKVARASVASIWQQNGKMYFLKGAEWLEEYQKEIYKFPKAKKRDQVDATSLAAIVVRSRGPLSDDDGNYDEIPMPIEGPPEPINDKSREIPFTQPFVKVEENDIPVEYVKPIIKPESPWDYAARVFGNDW